jgi:PII-like signaling protein
MKQTEVTVVRLYLNEGEAQLESLLKRLHDWERVKGVSVFRGIAGFGDSGEIHTSKFIDLGMKLPLVVEFFDLPEKVAAIMEHISITTKPGHMLSWSAFVNEPEQD